MADLPLFADLFQIGRDEALVRNSRLSLDVIDREGTDSNVLVAAAAAMGDELVAQLVQLMAAAFLDSADGDDLDRLVFDRYGLVRKPAAAALGTVQFSTTNANPGPFTIPANFPLSTSDGRQFLTTQPEVFPAGSTGPVLVPVRSVLAGADQQAKIGTITSITGQIPGAPNDLVVTNTLATSGAADAESDASLRQRAKAYFRTARRGTRAAIEEGALAVPGVVKARAFEVIDPNGRQARFVLLVVADQYTDQLASLTVVPAAYETQSQQLAQQVFAGLDDVRACGVYVLVSVAQTILQPVHLQLRFRAGADIDLTAMQARAMLVAKTNELEPGDAWDPAAMQQALKSVPGLEYTGTEITSPPGVVVTKPLQVLRTTLGLVTAANVLPEQPLANTTNPDAYQPVAGG